MPGIVELVVVDLVVVDLVVVDLVVVDLVVVGTTDDDDPVDRPGEAVDDELQLATSASTTATPTPIAARGNAIAVQSVSTR